MISPISFLRVEEQQQMNCMGTSQLLLGPKVNINHTKVILGNGGVTIVPNTAATVNVSVESVETIIHKHMLLGKVCTY